MSWKPIKLPKAPVGPEESDTSVGCSGCGAKVGEPCKTSACGTYDD
jgi:hypothetical protein